jgi:hypothetical protein
MGQNKPPRRFDTFVVIDWSGANIAKPKGLAVAYAERGNEAPTLLSPDGGWSRQSILDWLLEHAKEGTNMLVGLDLSPALPFADHGAYFPTWDHSPPDAKSLWQMVDAFSQKSDHLSANGFLAHPEVHRHFRHHNGEGDLFEGGRGRLRECEKVQKEMGLVPSSCLNLVGAAQVGKSSLTGMRVLNRLGGSIPVWPMDEIGENGPVIIEIYTSLAAREGGIRKGRSKVWEGGALDELLENFGSLPHAPLPQYTDHATDAILTAAWLRKVADDPKKWSPTGLTAQIAVTEGWTFGAV